MKVEPASHPIASHCPRSSRSVNIVDHAPLIDLFLNHVVRVRGAEVLNLNSVEIWVYTSLMAWFLLKAFPKRFLGAS